MTITAQTKTQPYCAECGSIEVSHDATARWDMTKQDWVISGIFDNADCDNCGECKLRWSNGEPE